MAKSQPPTIVFVAAIAPSIKMFVSGIAHELTRRGYRCVAVAGRGDASAALREDFDDVYDITPFRRAGLSGAARATRELITIARRERASLLHLHTPYGVALGRVAARATGTPQLAVVHGTLFDARTRAGRLFSAVESAMAWATPTYVVLNPDDLATYRRLAPGSRIHLAPCGGQGVEPPFLAHRPGHLRGATEHPPRVLIIGRLTPDKNLDLAVAAWRQAKLTVPALELHIVGSTADGERPWIPPREPGVVVRSWTSEPQTEIAAADVLLSTSLREGFPMAVTEALALGTPVVAVDNRGTRAVVDQVAEGMSLVPANRAALAAALLTQIRAATVTVRSTALRSWRRDHVVAFHADRVEEAIGRSATAPVPKEPIASPG